MRALILFAAPLLFAQPAPAPAPIFARENIVLSGARAWPGAVVELYGQHLAPDPWCGENTTPPAPYPVEVCGVRVLVGTSPASLMYVGPGQINFRIPAGAPAEGPVPFQVCVRSVCSAPVAVQFGPAKAALKLRGTAAVHMPVWVEIDAPAPDQVRYPCADWAWSFDGYHFEVRRNGQLLSPAPQPKRAGGGAAMAFSPGTGGCSGFAEPSALPLHLLYDFDQPGVYSVRFSATQLGGPGNGTIVCQSAWTDITVEPYAAAKRDAWLQSMAEKVTAASPKALIADVVPSLLAWPDDKALTVLLPLLTLPNATNGSDEIGYAGQFARASLGLFDEETLRRAIPPDQLLNFCPPDGRCRKAN